MAKVWSLGFKISPTEATELLSEFVIVQINQCLCYYIPESDLEK